MVAGSAGELSLAVKEGDLLHDIAPTAPKLSPDAAEEAMAIVLDEMKFVWLDYDVYFCDLLEIN